ncbi:hypothetical protein DSO57_1032523 [Entomophthora muscae]|uniref:Uncharacterized protein n=1 Tax=Entomophthora muscae TaxID=34485 RepID=A0ACC2SPE8_9FUNG|nr:hypothetical protein DSO57_1032523 [Entomophthora muscae]
MIHLTDIDLPQPCILGAYSQCHLAYNSHIILEAGVSWSGPDIKKFDEFHRNLSAKVDGTFYNYKMNNIAHASGSSVMIISIEPIWLEPELVFSLRYLEPGRDEPNGLKITTEAGFLYNEHRELTEKARKIIPNSFSTPKVQFPNDFFKGISFTEEYSWIRVLAFKVKGQSNKRTIRKTRSSNKVIPLSAIIPSILPSGYTNAIYGKINFCAKEHIKEMLKEIGIIQSFYCNE